MRRRPRALHPLGTHFLVRTCIDRLAGDGGHTIAEAWSRRRACPWVWPRSSSGPARSSKAPLPSRRKLTRHGFRSRVRRAFAGWKTCASRKGRLETVIVELRYRSIRVLPTIGKQKRYPALTLTVLYVQERNEPADRRPTQDGGLSTNQPYLWRMRPWWRSGRSVATARSAERVVMLCTRRPGREGHPLDIGNTSQSRRCI